MIYAIIAIVLLTMVPLLWAEMQAGPRVKKFILAELQVQIESWGGEGFLGKTVKNVITQYESDRKEAAAREVREAAGKVRTHHKEKLTQALKDADISVYDEYGTGDKGYPLAVRVPADKLSQARSTLRAFYGLWSDHIEAVSVEKCWNDDWSAQKNFVIAKFLGPEVAGHYLALVVRYEMDAVPVGLLKPGCKIEAKEPEFTVTCAA